MSHHNYTNPAFCQNSEFYPVPSASKSSESPYDASSYYNRSLNFTATRNPRDGPLRIQRSMSTRSFISKKTSLPTTTAPIHQRQQFRVPLDNTKSARIDSGIQRTSSKSVNLNRTAEPFDNRSGSGRYALVPVEELPTSRSSRYAIVPDTMANMVSNKRYSKSQDDLNFYGVAAPKGDRFCSDEEPRSFPYDDDEQAEQFTSLPPISIFNDLSPQQQQQQQQMQQMQQSQQQNFQRQPSRIKHAFSSDFGSKSLVIVDQKSNQRYTMVPTAEDEEIVDDNQEIIQMHNGRVHRYAVIPADENEEETCLSTSDLDQSHTYLTYESNHTPMQTSTPQKGNTTSFPGTPIKNPAATRKLHELLCTPMKTPINHRREQSTPRNLNRKPQYYQSETQIYSSQRDRKRELHYESVKQASVVQHEAARSTAIITPRVAGANYQQSEDCSSIHSKSWNNNSYPQKVANATITLAVVSLMLILGSAVNTGLSIYMIAHMGKSFYLQFSLAAAIAGVGLGFLGFRSRHCEWLPNRSYTSGYVLLTMFCLFKCCGLLVLLVLNPYPGFPLHDVTTGIILGLSTFTIFFIGLGVIGTLWCYRPPPDNRVNVI